MLIEHFMKKADSVLHLSSFFFERDITYYPFFESMSHHIPYRIFEALEATKKETGQVF